MIPVKKAYDPSNVLTQIAKFASGLENQVSALLGLSMVEQGDGRAIVI
jgi:hypothetical protein